MMRMRKGCWCMPGRFAPRIIFCRRRCAAVRIRRHCGDLAGELTAYLKAGLDGVFIDQPILGVRTRDALLSYATPS